MSTGKAKIILDTDIGPDCDDVGALALLHELTIDNKAEILAVTHCTSNPYGARCIDAINLAYGSRNIPIGTYKKKGFLDKEEHKKYNRYIANHYTNRYHDNDSISDAVVVLRQALSKQEDKSTIICAIGPLNNISDLLSSKPDEISCLTGKELIKQKVKRLVVMGGGMRITEWNFSMCKPAARQVANSWPTPIWYTTFEIGRSIITGVNWHDMDRSHPVRKAYELYAPDGRMSWDLVAVWIAVMGPKPYFKLSEPGSLQVKEDGFSQWYEDVNGNHRYVLQVMPDEKIAEDFDAIISRGRTKF